MKRIIGLDIVRSTAIILVIASHLALPLDFLGIYGVEIFFALSGFLIGGIICRRLASAPLWTFAEVKNFWLRRWWRTLPNYYLFLLLSVLFHIYFWNGRPQLGELLSFLVFCQDLFGKTSGFYGVSWSIAIEEWFYFLLPLCILLCTCLGASKRMALVITIVIFLIVPPIIREFMYSQGASELVRFATIPRLDSIIYGALVAFFVYKNHIDHSKKRILAVFSFISLIAILCYHYYTSLSGANTMFYRVALIALPLTSSLALPWFASIDNLPFGLALFRRPITSISLWSYSLYLSHIPIIFMTYHVFGSARISLIGNIFSKIVALLICFAASFLIFRYFETPLTKIRPAERPAPS